MNIDCKYCHQPIVDECVPSTSTAITCPECNMVADYRWQLEPAPGEEVATTESQHRSPPTLAKGWQLEQVASPIQHGGTYRTRATGEPTLLLSRRWAMPRKLSLLWMTVFVLCGLFTLFLQLELWQPMAGCILGLLAIGGVLRVNRTTLCVEGDWLRIRHAPVPWVGHQEIRKDEVQQVFCRRYMSLDGETVCYEVYVSLHDRQQQLMGELESAEEALYIKQLIASAWELDEPVVGELPIQAS